MTILCFRRAAAIIIGALRFIAEIMVYGEALPVAYADPTHEHAFELLDAVNEDVKRKRRFAELAPAASPALRASA